MEKNTSCRVLDEKHRQTVGGRVMNYRPMTQADRSVTASRFERTVRSKSRHGRQRLHLADALLLDEIGQEECKIDRLFGIEARIANRVIAVVEILVADLAHPSRAFGHVLAGHLQVHTTRIGAFRGMDLKKSTHLFEDQVERPR